jgi:arylsulfatase A-like enzyme
MRCFRLQVTMVMFGLATAIASVSLGQTEQTAERYEVKRLLGEQRERAYTAREERWAFPGLPKETDWFDARIESGERAIKIADFISPDFYASFTLGLRVIAKSMGGIRVEDIHLDRSGFGRFNDIAVNVVPDVMQEWDSPLLSNMKIRVHERFPIATSKYLANIEVPKDARLVVGFGLFDDLSRAVADTSQADTTNAYIWNVYHGRRAVPVSFEVFADTEKGAVRLFQEVYPPSHEKAGDYAWQDRTIDLAQYAGQTISFRFETRVARVFHDRQAAEWFPIWSEPVLLTPGSSVKTPNLILISLDTLRADHLGAYGYERDTSPNFDKFAENAFLFERCIAPSSWTAPSHVTAFTGLPPSVHMAGMWQGWRLRPQFTTLTEMAEQKGYVTAAYTDGVVMQASFGLSQGFDRYSDGRKAHVQGRRADDTFANGTEFIETYGDAPFFLFLHTYQIHSPYRPPTPFREKFTKDEDNPGLPTANISDPKERKVHIDLYDAGIAYTDYVLGNFFDYLNESGCLENTIVVIFSDHGEEFWEHGNVTHGLTLYQEQLHVPLVIRIPEFEEQPIRISNIVGLVDVFSTLADLMQLEGARPDTSQSLVPLMRASSPTEYSRDRVVSELMSRGQNRYFVSVQSPDEKYVLSVPYDDPIDLLHGLRDAPPSIRQVSALWDLMRSVEFRDAPDPWNELWYNLRSDPSEQRPLPLTSEARARFRQLLYDAAAPYTLMAPSGVFDADASQGLTAQEIEELRALGYVE